MCFECYAETMSNEATTDEKPKRKIAKQVIAEKRQYFVPTARNASVEATDAEDAVEQAQKLDAEEEGDAE